MQELKYIATDEKDVIGVVVCYKHEGSHNNPYKTIYIKNAVRTFIECEELKEEISQWINCTGVERCTILNITYFERNSND